MAEAEFTRMYIVDILHNGHPRNTMCVHLSMQFALKCNLPHFRCMTIWDVNGRVDIYRKVSRNFDVTFDLSPWLFSNESMHRRKLCFTFQRELRIMFYISKVCFLGSNWIFSSKYISNLTINNKLLTFRLKNVSFYSLWKQLKFNTFKIVIKLIKQNWCKNNFDQRMYKQSEYQDYLRLN